MKVLTTRRGATPPLWLLIGSEVGGLLLMLAIMLATGAHIAVMISMIIAYMLISVAIDVIVIKMREINKKIMEVKDKIKVEKDGIRVNGRKLTGKKVEIEGRWVSTGNTRSYRVSVRDYNGKGYGYIITRGGEGKLIGELYKLDDVRILLIRKTNLKFKEEEIFMKHEAGDRAIISVSDAIEVKAQYYRKKGRKLKIFLEVGKFNFKIGEVEEGIKEIKYPVNVDDDLGIVGWRITPVNVPLAPGVKGDAWEYYLKAVIDIPFGKDVVKKVKLESTQSETG